MNELIRKAERGSCGVAEYSLAVSCSAPTVCEDYGIGEGEGEFSCIGQSDSQRKTSGIVAPYDKVSDVNEIKSRAGSEQCVLGVRSDQISDNSSLK